MDMPMDGGKKRHARRRVCRAKVDREGRNRHWIAEVNATVVVGLETDEREKIRPLQRGEDTRVAGMKRIL